jgi:hypothetical protein
VRGVLLVCQFLVVFGSSRFVLGFSSRFALEAVCRLDCSRDEGLRLLLISFYFLP